MSTLAQPTTPRLTSRDLARYIDHTLLKPEATETQIEQLCEEARRYHFMAVCVNPIWVKRCVTLLSSTDTCVAAVAGFPLGATLTAVKAFEAQQMVESGAREIDMVINIGALKGRDYTL